MAYNMDVVVMEKKIYELTTRTPDQLDAEKWRALLLMQPWTLTASGKGRRQRVVRGPVRGPFAVLP